MCTAGTVFYYNGKYYRQIDGVAMGSPLGPDMANSFLSHHEIDWLDECPLSFAPLFFARYVDDIFILIRSNEHIQLLADYFSSRHPNIKFTFELENNNFIPFLDVNVFRDARSFSSSIHRKDTFSGVYTNAQSFMPETYKRGLISTLLYRAYMVSSSYLSLHEEIDKLKTIFSKNGYQKKFIDRCIFRFLDNLYTKKEVVATVPKKEVEIMLPFLGSVSWKMKNDLLRCLKTAAPFCKLKIIFRTNRRLSSCFNFKDRFPKSLLSGVVYKYTCATCNRSYIGSTKRYWEKRLEEHLHVSALTGKPLKGCQIFAPLAHVRSGVCSERKISRENFCILAKEKDSYLVRLKESILTTTTRPVLSNNVTSVPIDLF